MTRKKLLALNFFPAFTPPKSGGELRYYHLYRFLREYYDVTMVNPTQLFVPPETVHHFPDMVEHRVPKGRIHLNLHRLFDKIGRFPECSAAVMMLSCRWKNDLEQKAREFMDQADVVVLENPFIARIAPKRPGQMLVYNSYNVEYDMQRAMLKGPLGRLLCSMVRREEGRLCRTADLILATSEEDRRRFAQLYDISLRRIVLIPNGVDADEIRPAGFEERRQARQLLNLGDEPAFVFFGSAHPPNVKAAEFILEDVAPGIPEALFLIAGAVCSKIKSEPPPNARLLGMVDEEHRRLLFQGPDAALNPMFSGSGTNLKMFDYMSAGMPVVCTPTGGRGIPIVSGRDAIVAGPEEFSSAVRDLMRNRDMSDALGRNARALVEKRFHWKNLARDMKDAIEEARRPHVTVFNDFPVDRPRHGGQFRIHNLYSRLALHTPVHYFCLQKESDEEEEIIISKNFTQTALPKSFLHRATESLLGRWMGNISVEDILCISFGHHNAFLLREVREAARHGDILITVHPYLWKIIRKYRGHIRIYESLNYETELKKKTLKGILGRFLSWNTGRIERRAVRESSLVLTVSDEEWAAFERDFGVKGKCLTIPNGTDTTQITPSSPEATRQIKEYLGLDGMPVALFLGSAHPPNVEAGWHIIGRIAPQVPDCLFFIVGSVCWVLKNAREIPANVKLFYEVDNASRDVFLRCADMAVNPMTTGAGTSLKMFDFLAAGLPVISTPLGARGVADGNCDFMILNDIEEFPEAIHRLLSDTNWRSRLGIQGRRRVEECFDWGVIAQEMAGRLEDMVGK